MPNMSENIWIVLIVILLIALAVYLTFYFLKSNYKVKLNSILERENILKSNYDEYKIDSQKEIAALNSLRDNLTNERNKLNLEVSSLSSEINNFHQKIAEFKEKTSTLNDKIAAIDTERNDLNIKLTQVHTENKNLNQKLQDERQQLDELNQRFQKEFENMANKILEEKSTKFATQNKESLDLILKPFQEKITELKNTVNETYDKESKQRFSLGEKVKELAQLNQQISEDAKRLTKALKNDSKTQGNWGEMILESILEKSGLVKGREYFMEHQLTDNDNKAIISELSGKKMRPDAVIKYPDERNVIIDSKVSLTAFTDMIDETDAELYQIKLNQHLASLKNHINQLSQKAYDDYDKSLDFVMMFVPSEPAYIAAMQADPQLWEYAYNKRILLMNPSNLITSLKLIADLWKREYQNQNAKEIAERGAKLYDKFIGFVDNLEKVGKNIQQAQNVYNDAYRQLHTGRDNLVLQTQKLKKLGLKTKKKMPPSLLDNAQDLNSGEE